MSKFVMLRFYCNFCTAVCLSANVKMSQAAYVRRDGNFYTCFFANFIFFPPVKELEDRLRLGKVIAKIQHHPF